MKKAKKKAEPKQPTVVHRAKGQRFHFTIPIQKVVEERREVWGYATVEEIDKQGEIVEFEASKKAFAAAAEYFQKITKGESLGNIREMHQPSVAGKTIAWSADDEKRGILIGTKIVDDAAWQKCKERAYTQFSIGGDPVEEEIEERDGQSVNVIKAYALVETSLVDHGASPGSVFTVVKMDRPKEPAPAPAPTDQPAKPAPDLLALKADVKVRFQKAMGILKTAYPETASLFPALEALAGLFRAMESEFFEAMNAGNTNADVDKEDVATLTAAAESVLEFIAAELQEQLSSLTAPEGALMNAGKEALAQLQTLMKSLTPGALKLLKQDDEMQDNLDGIHEMGHGLAKASFAMGAKCKTNLCKQDDADDKDKPDADADADDTKADEPNDNGDKPDNDADDTKADEPDDGDKPATGDEPGDGDKRRKATAPPKKTKKDDDLSVTLTKVLGEVMAPVAELIKSMDGRVKKVEQQPGSIGQPVAADKHAPGIVPGDAQDAIQVGIDGLQKVLGETKHPEAQAEIRKEIARLECLKLGRRTA